MLSEIRTITAILLYIIFLSQLQLPNGNKLIGNGKKHSKNSATSSISNELIACDGILGFTPLGKIKFYHGSHYLIPEMTDPNFTKSGRHIIFLRFNQDAKNDDDFDMGIWKMDDDGKHLTKFSTLHIYDIALSPNGRYFAYVNSYVDEIEQDDCRSSIGILDLHTMHYREITSHNTEYLHPDWSPNGKKIVFSKFIDDTRLIFIMNRNGRHQHLAFMQSTAYSYDHPSWSPDGKSIAFCKETEQGEALMVYNLLTHQFKKVATNIFRATPAWSPHEHYMAFASGTPKGRYAAILNLRTGKRLIVDKHPIVYSRFTWAVIHKTK